MKTLFYCLAALLSLSAVAQENKVLNQLKAYHFPMDLLAKSIGGAEVNANYSFHATIRSCIDSVTIIEEAKYDPSQKFDERWTLLTYNGKEPSAKELKEFNKNHNFKEEEIKAKIDDASWDIERDRNDYLVVNFKYDSTSSKGRFKYLADMKGKAYFNKRTKLLEKVEYTNERPTKMRPFNVTTFYMLVHYNFNRTENLYQVATEEINMDVKALGKTVLVKDIYEYTNYQKQ
ncbi:hypothetical protein [Carboxylicivirga taeanensis]|uniref:hypothetical protein n=1 Tax=Carboxylicivirga taeanensis TaxID=1416875 RepID=UPI003F6DF0E7